VNRDAPFSDYPTRSELTPASDGSKPAGSYHKHTHIKLMAVFYTFWALISIALVLLAGFKILTEDTGYLVMFCVFGFIGLLTGYQAKHYLSDLGRAPVTCEGEVLRKWHKGNLLVFLFPSFYIFVDDKIFSIPRQDYALLLDDDLVRISHYPGSLTVDFVERYDTLDKRFVPTTHGVSL
jgi:hypothetical protein